MTVTLQPFPSADLPEWLITHRDAYIGERQRAGDDRAAAERNALQSYERFFPGNRPADGHEVFQVVAEVDRPVGFIWIGPHPNGVDGVLYIWDIEIDEAERGSGYGRAAMLAAEEHARRKGAQALALNVFGFNTKARALYTSLGYETTAIQMRKELTAEPAE